jgi:hypothetical protein
MNNLRDILVEIQNGDLNIDDLNLIIEAVKLKRQYFSRKAIRQFKIGDRIQFISKAGLPIGGKVVKVNIKYVVCDTALGKYRVPATMLTKQEA